MTLNIAYGLAGLIGLGIILIGVRFLWAPEVAAAAFGIPGRPAEARSFHAWLGVKGVRDIASGLFIFILMANGPSRLVGEFMLAACLIPLGDAVSVLRSGGSKAAAYGIHGATAAVMLIISLLLILA